MLVLAPLAAYLSLFAGFMDLGPGWGHSDTQRPHIYKSNKPITDEMSERTLNMRVYFRDFSPAKFLCDIQG